MCTYQVIAWEGHLNYLNNKICGTILCLPATLGLAIYPLVPVPSSRLPSGTPVQKHRGCHHWACGICRCLPGGSRWGKTSLLSWAQVASSLRHPWDREAAAHHGLGSGASFFSADPNPLLMLALYVPSLILHYVLDFSFWHGPPVSE